MRYVWMNINTGEFSNSWPESEHSQFSEYLMNRAKEAGWKLIKYSCENDSDFEFYNLMKITTKL